MSTFEKSASYSPRPEDFVPKVPRDLEAFDLWPSKIFFTKAILSGFFVSLVSAMIWNWDSNYHFAVSGHKVFTELRLESLFTALVAHSSIEHLLSNMLPFVVFSWLLWGYFGWVAFPVLPLLGGLLSNLVTVATYPPNILLLGISGMVYCMITLWLVLYIKNETTHQTPKKLLRVIGFCLLMLFPSGEAKQVSHLAHFSGGLFGILLGIIYLPWAKVKPNPSLFFVNFNRKLKFFNQPFWSRRPLRVWSI